MDIEQIRELVRQGNYYFYSHALTEAKKDGVSPEDVIYVILTGEVIEEYSDRQRMLVFGTMSNELPLHVVCDYSAGNVVLIPTVYIPDDREWIGFKVRKRRKGWRK